MWGCVADGSDDVIPRDENHGNDVTGWAAVAQ